MNAGPPFEPSHPPLMEGSPGDWASDWGEDGFGAWAAFSLGDVTQRMRWIPPGRFLMGSPEDEPGRFGESEYEGRFNEGPRHEVRISRGFWLFDTPVTQALWKAVMNNRPSRFLDPKRPVEYLTGFHIDDFLARINGLIPGLDLVLPTEAQWEYASRAGTDTATYAGPMEILSENNVPILDAIAWYGGNSGIEFDLEDSEDSSDWPEKQYEHTRAGTRQVGLKKPNAWGCYDTLGNVWECCADDLRQYTADSATDPVGRLDGAERVLRGGSWWDGARSARAARRFADYYHDGGMLDTIGFRCARLGP